MLIVKKEPHPNEIEDINKDEAEAAESAKRFEDAFNSTRQKLEITGLSQILGQILQQEKRSLPDTRDFHTHAISREQKIADTSLSQIQLKEEKRKLRNLTTYINELGARIPSQDLVKIKAELKALGAALF
ncbi:hypothetical protein [Zooshikella ganghwensis]|uniref:Uncharacterized protein n=1 Tax=Zooshikella ganghwensis TaxID=202772 RepID=A0A4P9VPQ9_9GAMM|nr:hypothetical protein [Zooshikella ganghwensis]RDH45485.1 hypothetical protein B9G39_19670 [Zooshikella ganghwensis]